MGFLQKLFNPLGYAGGVILVLLGISPADVAGWLARHALVELQAWILSEEGRWAFLFLGCLLFIATERRRRRRLEETAAPSSCSTPSTRRLAFHHQL
jgi:hypothetical protein